jgi:hypothetical protein
VIRSATCAAPLAVLFHWIFPSRCCVSSSSTLRIKLLKESEMTQFARYLAGTVCCILF